MSNVEDDWQPPSEVEMQQIQLRRERSDKIASLMGQYMLRGYRMLNESCPKCGTVVLQNANDVKYCVACIEVDRLENSAPNASRNCNHISNANAETNMPPKALRHRRHFHGKRAQPNVLESIDASSNAKPDVLERSHHFDTFDSSCYDTQCSDAVCKSIDSVTLKLVKLTDLLDNEQLDLERMKTCMETIDTAAKCLNSLLIAAETIHKQSL